MAVKKTTEQIVTVFRYINTAKLSKLDTSERYALILITRQLKKVNDEFNDIVKDAQEKLKPEEGMDVIISKFQNKESLTADEQFVFNKYNKEVAECADTALKNEVEIDIEPLSKEVLDKFLDSNDFSVGEILAIEDVIGANHVE